MTKPAIPAEALAHHIAILAKTGAGKSYAAQGIAEYLLSKGERVCVMDPTGRWWGLRSNAEGTGPGYPVVVFGGQHADVPLEPHHGTELAEIVGTTNTPAIFDTRAMTVSGRTRFFTDFAETLIRKNKGPLTVVIDEAHLFMPQGGAKVGGGAPAMLHAGNNLVSLGRGVGLRIILISQRPAKLHKDGLTQVETLIALRLIAPQDRNAIKDWISEWADPSEGRDLIAGLPELPTGTGWIWAPELGVLDKVKFPPIKTWDGGKPQTDEAPVLATIDVPEIMNRLGRIAEEAKANDPKALKAEIARLKRESGVDPKAVEEARREGYERGLQQGAQQQAAKDREIMEGMRRAIEAASGYLVPFIEGKGDDIPVIEVRRAPPPRTIEHRPAPPRRAAVGHANGTLGAERRILKVLAQRHPAKFTEAQWATLAGMKRTGGTWNTYKSRLRTAGCIEQSGGLWGCTAEGLDMAGEVEPAPQTPEELREMWFAKLGAERKVLQTVIERGPIARDELADVLDMTATGGTFNTYLSRLRANDLITVQDGYIEASAELTA